MKESIINSFNNLKVLVVGDVMIDSYIMGHMDRISPEAPVPVVSIKNREERLGGAANVALNIQSLGAIPLLCGVVGKDKMGERFKNLLSNSRISTDGIMQVEDRPTTVKHRVMAGNHHVLRIDEETEQELRAEEKLKLHSIINELISDCNVVIIEDYDKGLLCEETIQYIRQRSKMQNIPVVVDPKKKNFHFYNDLSLLKPNLKELQEGINEKLDINNLDIIKKAVENLYEMMSCEAVMVTLSDKGVMMKKG
ncbi:MAG: bifunctional ADP-heptose synthase, partial [Cyclobacteriaceae bacterium]|nr:bifunctional ADP-heptose synthase [Cyclobacteriaceae bacterium]